MIDKRLVLFLATTLFFYYHYYYSWNFNLNVHPCLILTLLSSSAFKREIKGGISFRWEQALQKVHGLKLALYDETKTHIIAHPSLCSLSRGKGPFTGGPDCLVSKVTLEPALLLSVISVTVSQHGSGSSLHRAMCLPCSLFKWLENGALNTVSLYWVGKYQLFFFFFFHPGNFQKKSPSPKYWSSISPQKHCPLVWIFNRPIVSRLMEIISPEEVSP